MPTIAPSYIYAFFALVAVSSILISSFAAYATSLRTLPEMRQLQNLLNRVAAKSCELITLTTTTNSSSEAVLKLPSTIGNKHYWIRLHKETSKAWVEGVFSSMSLGNSTQRVYIPNFVFPSGNHSSAYGPAILECSMNGSTVKLHLESWRDSV